MFFLLMDVIFCVRREYFAAVGGALRYRHRSFTDLHLLHSLQLFQIFLKNHIKKKLSRWPLVEEGTTLAIDWLPYAKEMSPADAIGWQFQP